MTSATTLPAVPDRTAAGAPASSRAETRTARSGGDVRRHELAAFLRSRRERITPEQVGLVRGRRRRTPGLRREEVAQLSAVGVTWYTWIEQARDIQVSPEVLDALARALLLDASERAHLFALAGATDPAPGGPCPTVTPALRRLLDQLEPVPACVQSSRYDILAYNRAYARLLCDLDAIPPEDRNCVWLAFTNQEWRAAVVDLEGSNRRLVARFRAAMAGHLAEPKWKRMLERLEAVSPEFREIWARHEVIAQGDRTKYIRSPHVGLLHLEHTSLWLGPAAGPRLVTYVPADEPSRAALERLRDLPPSPAAGPVAAAAGPGPATGGAGPDSVTGAATR
ncbi:helix-turn-helix domain-containing protein [Streptomyces sp. LP05-1]|uniref:Helix-turn-helix domain-containing protein n=1 Tax=Streptomyces pyxinae TaxID=2970734 RepID=A0ABT2CLB9_9ACTN|nr:helix-turn-helix domain-containing protein [Streptomyces sp. LP05-1]MCS0638197.1 helix-turn-helix domain-containing protein [Streptomyces sp. LP05-1]